MHGLAPLLALAAVVSLEAQPAAHAERSAAARAPLVVGHRGAPHELPESTLSGFALALAHGEMIELDVRASADGVLVVHHDATVPQRCAPHAGERIRALPFAALREIACAPLGAQRPLPGAQIPSLAEVLALVQVRAHARTVLVELKSDDAPAPAALARLLVATLERARARSLVIVESFEPSYVAAMRAHAPEVARGLLCADCASALATAEQLGALLVSPAHDRIDAAFVKDAHASGLGVVAWTANDAASWSRLRALGVDAIVTDDPRGLRASLPPAARAPP